MAEPGELSAGISPRSQHPAIRGVIFDWGGVLTGPVGETVLAWLEAEQIDRASYAAVIMPWIQLAYAGADPAADPAADSASDADRQRALALADSPVHRLERGEMSDAEFEQLLAGRLTRQAGRPVEAAGLLQRMFAASVPDTAMRDLIGLLRGSGLRIGLLSNSWGSDGYPRHLFAELFDDVVISCEVGMRKPEERIFALAASRLGMPPADCVFVDDLETNVAAARALGFAVVHHRDRHQTRQQLSDLLGIGLS